MASPSSRRKTRCIINEFEYGDDFDVPGFDQDVYLMDNPGNQDVRPSAEAGAPPMTSSPVEVLVTELPR